MNEPNPPRWLPSVPEVPSGMGAALLISFLVGVSLTFSRGAYSEPALTCIVIAMFVVIFQLQDTLRRPSTMEVAPRMFAPIIFAALVGMAFSQWNDPAPIIYPRAPWQLGRDVQVMWLVLLFSYVPFFVTALKEYRWLRYVRFGIFGGLLLLGGYDTIRASPRPFIDVWTMQQLGARYLLEGRNPYEDITVRDTGPRNVADVPYVYPPTQLYLTIPAWRFGGDVRWTMLASLLITGFALRYITRKANLSVPGIVEDAPALFLWLSPKLFFILEQAWVDPVQLMLITVATAIHVSRRPNASAVAFGIAATAKQTMFWMIPLVGVLLRFNLRQWILAVAVGTSMVLPFAIWDFRALKHANLDFLSALPPRPDALTIVNWVSRKFQLDVPGQVGFGLAAAVVALALWRLRGSLAGFGVAAMSTFVFFFAFNKWAFANYYFQVFGLAALAAACAGHIPQRMREPEVALTPERVPSHTADARTGG